MDYHKYKKYKKKYRIISNINQVFQTGGGDYHVNIINNNPETNEPITLDNLLWSLFADQIHDFIQKTDRTSILQSSSIIHIIDLYQIWNNLPNLGKILNDKNFNSVNKQKLKDIIGSQGGEQARSENILEIMGCGHIDDFLSINITINKISKKYQEIFNNKHWTRTQKNKEYPLQVINIIRTKLEEGNLPYEEELKKLDLYIRNPDSLKTIKYLTQGENNELQELFLSTRRDKCNNSFTSKSIFERSLLPEEFNCFLEILKKYLQFNGIRFNPQIGLVIDAVKGRESTLSNYIILEDSSSLIVNQYHKLISNEKIKINKIIPNIYDEASVSSLFNLQKTISNNTSFTNENICNFSVSDSRNNNLSWQLIKFPNVLEIIFNYQDYDLLFSKNIDTDLDESDLSYMWNDSKNSKDENKLLKTLYDLSIKYQESTTSWSLTKKTSTLRDWCDIKNSYTENLDTQGKDFFIEILNSLSIKEKKLIEYYSNPNIPDECRYKYNELVSFHYKHKKISNDLNKLYDSLNNYYVNCHKDKILTNEFGRHLNGKLKQLIIILCKNLWNKQVRKLYTNLEIENKEKNIKPSLYQKYTKFIEKMKDKLDKIYLKIGKFFNKDKNYLLKVDDDMIINIDEFHLRGIKKRKNIDKNLDTLFKDIEHGGKKIICFLEIFNILTNIFKTDSKKSMGNKFYKYFTYTILGSHNTIIENTNLSECNLIVLQIFWIYLLDFLSKKEKLDKKIIDQIIHQRVISTDLTINYNNKNHSFTNEQDKLFRFLLNRDNEGPSVNNLSEYIRQINYFYSDAKKLKGIIFNGQSIELIRVEQKKKRVKRNKDNTLPNKFNIKLEGVLYKNINFQRIISELFHLGYINDINLPNKGVKLVYNTGSVVNQYLFTTLMAKTLCDFSIVIWVSSKNKPIFTNSFTNWDHNQLNTYISKTGILTQTQLIELSQIDFTVNNLLELAINNLGLSKDLCVKLNKILDIIREHESYYLFLTMDRTAASISTLIENMNQSTLLQKKASLESSLWVSPRCKIFNQNGIYQDDTIKQRCYDKTINLFR